MTKYNPDIHRRRSIRLKGYDYSQPGLYFITICTQNRSILLGDIENGKMILNDAGMMVHRIWNEITNNFHNIQLQAFIIMPNHIHGIIEITVGADSISAPSLSVKNATEVDTGAEMDSAPTPSIPEIV